MEIAVIFLIIAEVILALSISFLYLLVFVGTFQKESAPDCSPAKSFAIVVSAHNEEFFIGRLLENLRRLNYPKHLYDIYVVANNCTDKTAEIVRSKGAFCYERKDDVRKSKGNALAWLFQKILDGSDKYDAFVVFDADTVVSLNFLQVLNDKLCAGSEVIQGYYAVSNPEDSWLTRLFHIGFGVQNKMMLPGLSRLGKVCRLRGNGMCFTKQIIKNIGWKAFSMLEDMELYLQLLLADVRIEFAPQAQICAEMPPTLSRAKSQRMKWYRGHLEVTNRYVPRLLWQGLKTKSPAKIVGAVNTIVPPIASLFTLSVLVLILHFFVSQIKTSAGIVFPTVIVASEAIYVLIAMLLVRASFKSYLAMIFSPLFLVWRSVVQLLSLVLIRSDYHVRTDRPQSQMKTS